MTYEEFTNELAKRTQVLLQAEGWSPDQQTFWDTHVVRKKGWTVVLLMDALRYDLALGLKEDLEKTREFDVTARHYRAVPPTRTDIGMAALLPDAQQGIGFSVDGEGDAVKYTVSLGERDVTGTRLRREYLEEWLGERGNLLSLEEAERLEKSPGSKTWTSVVWWTGIDEYGGRAELEPSVFVKLLQRLRSLIAHLRDLGCARLLVVADHGFLFLPVTKPTRVLSPRGANAVKKDRFVAGAFAGTADSWEASAEELGLLGDTRFAFPLGTALFGRQGESPTFIHGGISLQEAIVPLLAVTSRARGKVGVTMEVPAEVTQGRLYMTLKATPRSLVDAPRRVVVEVSTAEGVCAESGEEVLKSSDSCVRISVLWSRGLAFSSPEVLSISLKDLDSGEILQTETVPVNMPFM